MKEKNKIIFTGSGKFAVPFLKHLIENNFNVFAVITQVDKTGGRGKKLLPTPVKKEALNYNLKILQPEDINSQEIIDFIKLNGIKLNVVISYGQILKKDLIETPEFNSINVHPSLLPRYRGASPIQNAILNGEDKTGISIIEINEKMDAGDILAQEIVEISFEDDFYSLNEKLIEKGKDLLTSTIIDIFNSRIEKVAQKHSLATYCQKITKLDGLINWNDSSMKIYNQIRALIDWPVCYTFHNGKMIKIYKAEIIGEKGEYPPGTIIRFDKKNFGVVCGDKKILKIDKLQLQGKKVLPSSDFLNGYSLKTGDIFTSGN